MSICSQYDGVMKAGQAIVQDKILGMSVSHCFIWPEENVHFSKKYANLPQLFWPRIPKCLKRQEETPIQFRNYNICRNTKNLEHLDL